MSGGRVVQNLPEGAYYVFADGRIFIDTRQPSHKMTRVNGMEVFMPIKEKKGNEHVRNDR